MVAKKLTVNDPLSWTKSHAIAFAGLVLLSLCSSFTVRAAQPSHAHSALPEGAGLTLAAAIDATLTNYPRTLELDARAAESQAWVARGRSWLADRPQASFRYQSDRSGSDNGLQEYEAGVQLPLWNWGARKAVRQLGDQMSIETSLASLALRWEIAGVLRVALWDIAIAENEHELAEQSLASLWRLAKSIERRHELGDVAIIDVLLAQSSHLEAQTALNEATAAVLDAQRAFRSVSGLETRPAFTAEELSERSTITPQHPELALANAEVDRAEAARRVVEKTVNSGASILIGPRRERPALASGFDDSIGITVTVPIGGSSHRRTAIAGQARVAAAARAAREQSTRTLRLMLHEAMHGLDVIRQNLDASSERSLLAERHLRMAESAYEKGEMNLIDLLRIRATAYRAERQMTGLLINQKRQISLYNQAVGMLP